MIATPLSLVSLVTGIVFTVQSVSINALLEVIPSFRYQKTRSYDLAGAITEIVPYLQG